MSGTSPSESSREPVEVDDNGLDGDDPLPSESTTLFVEFIELPEWSGETLDEKSGTVRGSWFRFKGRKWTSLSRSR